MNLAAVMTLNNRPFLAPMAQAQNAVRVGVSSMQSAFGTLAKTLSLVGVSFAAFKSVEGFTDSLQRRF